MEEDSLLGALSSRVLAVPGLQQHFPVTLKGLHHQCFQLLFRENEQKIHAKEFIREIKRHQSVLY